MEKESNNNNPPTQKVEQSPTQVEGLSGIIYENKKPEIGKIGDTIGQALSVNQHSVYIHYEES